MSNKFAGILGSMSVYVDTQTESEPILKYKTKQAFDVGAFYCPYVPLQLSGAPAYPHIEEVEEKGVWKFMLRRRSDSELPHFFADQSSADAFEWIKANVGRAGYEITYIQSDDFDMPTKFKTRYGYVDSSAAPPHYHMIIQFFFQKDAALFKLMHL